MARDSLGIDGDLAKLVQHRQWQYDTAATPERRRRRWKKLQEAVHAQQRSERREKSQKTDPQQTTKTRPSYSERQAAIRAEIESLRYLPIEERWRPPSDGHDHVWRYSEDAPNRYVMRCVYCYLPEKTELRYSPEPGPRREFI